MLSVIQNGEFKALMRLLDDPDEHISRNVSDHLVSFGPPVIPLLECERRMNGDDTVQGRISNIVRKIHLDDCRNALADWARKGGVDLMNGALIVSKFSSPEQDDKQVVSNFENIRKDIWIELNDHLTSLEKVIVMNHILFNIYGFKVVLKHHLPLSISCLDQVLETQQASSTSFSIVYKALADNLGIPIVALELPNMLLLGYSDKSSSEHGDIQFFLNPFGKCAAYGKHEAKRFLKNAGLRTPLDQLKQLSNIQLIARQLTDVRSVLANAQISEMTHEIDSLLAVLEPYVSI